VEGQSGRGDCCRCGIYIGENLSCWNMQYRETESRQHRIAFSVPCWSVATIVPFAIDLDDQLRFVAIEIGNIACDGMLTAKLHAASAPAQPLP